MKNAGERIMADGILENFIDLNTIFSSLEEGLFSLVILFTLILTETQKLQKRILTILQKDF